MKFKRLFIFLLFVLVTFTSANAITTLNSCGTPTGGWINNTIYNINLTNNDLSNTFLGQNYCFYFDNNAYNNITFNQINDKINLNSLSLFRIDKYYLKQNFNFNNINLILKHFTTATNGAFIFYNNLGSSGVGHTYNLNHNFNNVTIRQSDDKDINSNIVNLFYFGTYSATKMMHGTCVGNYGVTTQITNINFNNINIITNSAPIFTNAERYQNYGYPCNSFRYGRTYSHFNINNSILMVLNKDIYYQYKKSGIYEGYFYPSFINSVTYTSGGYEYNHDRINNNYTNSLNNQYNSVDNNHDNIDDLTNNTHFINSKLYLKLFNYSFIQDYNYGHHFINPNDKIVDINNENLLTNGFIGFTNDNNIFDFLGYINLDNRGAIDLGTSNKIDCSLISSSKCDFSDLNYAGITTGTYRGLLMVNSNNVINNIVMEKNSQSNNAHLIANSIDVTRTNLQISNSSFWKQDSRPANGDEQIFKLNYNNLKINNNEFSTGGASGTHYDLFSIQSPAPSSNKIYNNNFTSLLSDVGTTQIFSNNCDAQFYFNIIDSNYIVNDGTCNGTLELNPQIGYENPQDNKIYYFYGGNYYNGFSDTCTDADSDGYCDSVYTSGGVTDYHPLSEYPFNFQNHLFTALSVVDNSAFNITIFIPQTQNLIYNLNTSNDALEFQFSHNSNFNDLSCDYVINGQPLKHLSNVNNSKQSVFLTGWAEQYYSFYVECYNDYKYSSSELYSFYVNLPGGTDPQQNPGCTQTQATNFDPYAVIDDGSCLFPANTTITGCMDSIANNFNQYATINDSSCIYPINNNNNISGIINGSVTGSDLIDLNSVQNTSDNAVGMLSNVGAFIVNAGTPIAVVVVVIVLFLAIVRLIF